MKIIYNHFIEKRSNYIDLIDFSYVLPIVSVRNRILFIRCWQSMCCTTSGDRKIQCSWRWRFHPTFLTWTLMLCPIKKKKHAYALEDSYYHDYTRNMLNLLWYNVYHVNKHRIQCINRLKIWNLKNPHTSQKFIILIINITQIYDFLNLVWCWCWSRCACFLLCIRSPTLK